MATGRHQSATRHDPPACRTERYTVPPSCRVRGRRSRPPSGPYTGAGAAHPRLRRVTSPVRLPHSHLDGTRRYSHMPDLCSRTRISHRHFSEDGAATVTATAAPMTATGSSQRQLPRLTRVG